jgi:hypothetical protein
MDHDHVGFFIGEIMSGKSTQIQAETDKYQLLGAIDPDLPPSFMCGILIRWCGTR